VQSDVNDEVFNVGTGVQTSLNALCELLLKLTRSHLKPEYRELQKVTNVQTRRAAVEKATNMLSFTAKVSLEQGLRELIDWKRMAKRSAAFVTEAL